MQVNIPQLTPKPWVELRAVRDDLALTLAEMAQRTGYSDSHLSDLERGRRQPNARNIARIAKALRISREHLRPGTSGTPPEVGA